MWSANSEEEENNCAPFALPTPFSLPYTPEIVEMLKLAFELRAKGVIKF